MNELINSDNQITDSDIPGTAQIRKICDTMSSMELLNLCAKIAASGLEKKLWSLLSRVYEDKKGFDGFYDEAMKEPVMTIINSSMPSELKLQLYTSFELSEEFLPDRDISKNWIDTCNPKRKNIAGFFIVRYALERVFYSEIISDKDLFKTVIRAISGNRVAALYETIIENENKEVITGAIRLLDTSKLKIKEISEEEMKRLATLVFDSKEVFFTTKLLYCNVFGIPKKFLPMGRDLDKILTISINYEEKITKAFVSNYHLRFDVSDKALCKYYINNKKAANEKNLVLKFASHVVHVEDENDKNYLLRAAFKRGGYFRMYAGCMQDGCVNDEKLHRFKYSDDDITWVKNLPGLR